MTPRACLDCGAASRRGPRCPTCYRRHQQARNHDAGRQALYSGPWAAYSRSRRRTQPWCSICGAREDLTVDHDTNLVMCRSCNSSRRRDAS